LPDASALGAPASSFLQNVCPNEVTLTRAQEGHSTTPTAKLAEVLLGQPLSCKVNSISLSPQTKPESWSPVSTQMLLCLCGQVDYEDSDGQVYRLQQEIACLAMVIRPNAGATLAVSQP